MSVSNKDLITQYLASPTFVDKLNKLGKKYALADFEVDNLADILDLIARGELKYSDLSYQIYKRVNEAKYIEMTLDLEDNVIKNILPQLRKITENKSSEESKPAKSEYELFLETVFGNIGHLDAVLSDRLETIIQTYLRDLRDDMELNAVLSRSTKVGGMGLNETTARQLLDNLKLKKQELINAKITAEQFIGKKQEEAALAKETELKELYPDTTKPIAAPLPQPPSKDDWYKKTTGDRTISDLLKDAAPVIPETEPKKQTPKSNFYEELEESEEFLESKEEIKPPVAPQPKVAPPVPVKVPKAPVKPIITKPAPIVADINPKPAEPVQPPPAAPQPKAVSSQMPAARPVIQSQRPKMDDIAHTPKLTGPVDELGSLTLVDFRRLAPDPAKAISKIIEKLELLDAESVDKKTAGIKAMKKSPLLVLYSKILNRAFAQGQPPIQAITADDGITVAEFQAITKLNQLIKS